jgi:PAS domain-containing protein
VRWIESRSFISYGLKGNARRVVGVNIDVTERKQTEALLKESKARLSDALAAGQVVAFEWDAATGRSQRNDNAERILELCKAVDFSDRFILLTTGISRRLYAIFPPAILHTL